MPRPSYAELQELNRRLQRHVGELSRDPAFGVLARPAIPFELARVHDAARWVVFADVDDMGGLNAALGYEAVNGMIKRAVHVRAADVILRARWFSGDEFLFILADGDPAAFCRRLATFCRNQGFTMTLAYSAYSGDLAADVHAAASAVQSAKSAGHSAAVVRAESGSTLWPSK